MSLITVVRDVCAVVGIALPSSIFAGLSSSRTQQELLACANEMAQRIAYDNRDWTVLRAQATFTGDALAPDPDGNVFGTTAFQLPANYKRMLLTADVWRSTSTQQPMTFIPDTNEWMRRRLANESESWGEWTMLGGKMHIWPPMAGPIDGAPAVKATFAYLDKNCIMMGEDPSPLSLYNDKFTTDADMFRLDERLLKLGMIAQWKAQKGAPYSEDLATFGDALTTAMGKDSPSPILIQRRPSSWNARIAYPGQVSGPVWPLT